MTEEQRELIERLKFWWRITGRGEQADCVDRDIELVGTKEKMAKTILEREKHV